LGQKKADQNNRTAEKAKQATATQSMQRAANLTSLFRLPLPASAAKTKIITMTTSTMIAERTADLMSIRDAWTMATPEVMAKKANKYLSCGIFSIEVRTTLQCHWRSSNNLPHKSFGLFSGRGFLLSLSGTGSSPNGL
jgi:hypothetical protein